MNYPNKIKVKLSPEIHSPESRTVSPISPFHRHEVRNPNTAAGVAVNFSCTDLTPATPSYVEIVNRDPVPPTLSTSSVPCNLYDPKTWIARTLNIDRQQRLQHQQKPDWLTSVPLAQSRSDRDPGGSSRDGGTGGRRHDRTSGSCGLYMRKRAAVAFA